MTIDALLHQLAQTLNSLTEAGYTPDPRNGVSIADSSAEIHPQRVVWDDEDGRGWIVASR